MLWFIWYRYSNYILLFISIASVSFIVVLIAMSTLYKKKMPKKSRTNTRRLSHHKISKIKRRLLILYLHNIKHCEHTLYQIKIQFKTATKTHTAHFSLNNLLSWVVPTIFLVKNTFTTKIVTPFASGIAVSCTTVLDKDTNNFYVWHHRYRKQINNSTKLKGNAAPYRVRAVRVDAPAAIL